MMTYNLTTNVLSKFSNAIFKFPFTKNYVRYLGITAPSFNKNSDDNFGLSANPFYNKYAEKISSLKSKDKQTFEQRLNKVKEMRQPERLKPTEQRNEDILNSNRNKNLFHSNTKGLDSIVNLDKLKTLSPEDIILLWKDYHKNTDSLSAAIPVTTYEKIEKRALQYPMFLYAVARSDGYEFMVGHFSGHTYYFTRLINYQAHKENAPVCLTLTHFMELRDDKGIVLMKGEFDPHVLTVLEAQFLANQVQMYYGKDDGKKIRLLHLFNIDPDNFKHADVITNIVSEINL